MKNIIIISLFILLIYVLGKEENIINNLKVEDPASSMNPDIYGYSDIDNKTLNEISTLVLEKIKRNK